MSLFQPAILEDVPTLARYLTFRMRPDDDPRRSIEKLAALEGAEQRVVGLGPTLVSRLGGRVEGLRPHPSYSGRGVEVPSTGGALWVWLRSNDRGELVHQTRALCDAIGDGLALDEVTESFRYREGRDLSGYVDGTENPTGDEATAAGFASGSGPGVDGGSFVAVQRWVHDHDRLERMWPGERDEVIGRRLEDNVEMDDAPATAHVKRTAQEDFSPPAFVLRRSMPWAHPDESGLVFVAFGKSFDAYEALLARMVGEDDGKTDNLFTFTRPVTGGFFFCPPVRADGGLDLSAVLG